jgi:hypothetical protein
MDQGFKSPLNWNAETIPVALCVELPFWLMMPDTKLEIDCKGHKFKIEIDSSFFEFYKNEILQARTSCVYFGPITKKTIAQFNRKTKREKQIIVPKKCKTVLCIDSNCNKDVILAESDKGTKDINIARKNHAYGYLQTFCAAHIEIVNLLLNTYRLLTYDLFPYEVSPWDIPFWYLATPRKLIHVNIFPYSAWDQKPALIPLNKKPEIYNLISSADFLSNLTIEPGPGELEVLDAINYFERGNYADAVRRIVTSIEVILEANLRNLLLLGLSSSDVEKKLGKSRNRFPERLKEYEKLCGRILPTGSRKNLDDIRNLRHSIVHRASRIPFIDRFKAEKAVVTGRWLYNWFENDPSRASVREKNIATRSLGKNFTRFDSEINSTGVAVKEFT